MLNLSGVLLRFCHPICVKNKILKVDPSYAWTPSKQLSEETFLLSTEADDRRQQEEEKEFNFITEIFFFFKLFLFSGEFFFVSSLFGVKSVNSFSQNSNRMHILLISAIKMV